MVTLTELDNNEKGALLSTIRAITLYVGCGCGYMALLPTLTRSLSQELDRRYLRKGDRTSRRGCDDESVDENAPKLFFLGLATMSGADSSLNPCLDLSPI